MASAIDLAVRLKPAVGTSSFLLLPLNLQAKEKEAALVEQLLLFSLSVCLYVGGKSSETQDSDLLSPGKLLRTFYMFL